MAGCSESGDGGEQPRLRGSGGAPAHLGGGEGDHEQLKSAVDGRVADKAHVEGRRRVRRHASGHLGLQLQHPALQHGSDLEVGVGQQPLVIALLGPEDDLPQCVPARTPTHRMICRSACLHAH